MRASGVARTAAVALGFGAAAVVLGLAATAPAQQPSEGALAAEVWRNIFRRSPAPSPSRTEVTRVNLGLALFGDTRLSGDGTWSCETCHAGPTLTDGRVRGRGRNGPLKRNTPTLLGIGNAQRFNWDGSAGSLVAQFERPITSPDEMAGRWDQIVEDLGRDANYRALFRAAFPASPKIARATITEALAAAVRVFEAPRTRFDDWIAGNAAALSDEERAGFRIFTGKGGCATCHGGWRLTDDEFHNIGLAGGDPGRGAVPGGIKGLSAFKTPTLRQVANTAPYMHDGSKPDLAAVVAHYAGGLKPRPGLAETLVRDLSLSARERGELIAFLKTL
ncbi:MAG: cytochrome c peroxidase [Pseudomonadota bacterium]